MCSHSKRQYFYSVYTNSRICRFCWTDEDKTQPLPGMENAEDFTEKKEAA